MMKPLGSIRDLFLLRILFLSLVLLSLFLLSTTSSAQIYQWRDKQGQLHFGDKPPAKVKAKQVEVKINSYENVEVIYDPALFAKSKKKDKGGGRVVMYSTAWCGVCKIAKKYFTANKIPYTEYDVDKSAKGNRDYKKMNGTGVPILLVGKTRMNGFNQARFEKIYYPKKK